MQAADPPATDLWHDWLLGRRLGHDAALEQVVRAKVERYVERLLDAAALAPGQRIADIGCGEGVVAWRAFERVGPTLSALLADVSAPLLEHARARAEALGLAGRCRFLQCPADELGAVGDASLDLVTTRAALAYVADKPRALREFLRVLAPGGRLSMAEPVFRDDALTALALRQRAEAAGADAFIGLLQRWKAAQFPDSEAAIAASPIANYSERDLFAFAQAAGFEAVHLELHIDLRPAETRSWAAFLATSPHPWAPTLGQVMAERFSEAERALFEQVMRPAVEAGRTETVDRVAYLSARKPGA
ncbi:MAG: class I SAM-dependent methyltransferase [Burkholderiales bacterium]|nr:class I SAM-dependent methyltransferase [Burkholderiales bacterium]